MFSEMNCDVAVIEASSDAIMSKLNYEFDMMLMEHRQNLADIEANSVMESCTYDDLADMYYKEAEEIQQKSAGIFRRIIDAVKKLFKKIKDFIFGSKNEKPEDPNAKIPLPEDPVALEKETRGVIAKIKEFFSGKKDTIAKSALSGAVSGATSVVSSKATEWVINKASALANDVQTTLDNADKQIASGNMTPERQNEGRGLLNRLQNCGTRIMKCVKKIKGSNASNSDPDDQPIANQNDEPTEPETPENNQIRTLENENHSIKLTISKLEGKLRGDDKNETRRDRRQIEALRKLSAIPKKERTPREQAKFEELSNSREMKGDDRQKYIDTINNLKIRMKDNDSKLEALRKGQRKAEKRQAKEAERNTKKGNLSTDDLLKSARGLLN